MVSLFAEIVQFSIALFFYLTVACGPGSYQMSTERGRVYSGEGLRERYPVCTPCPFNHYEERIGSVGCQACPDYHQTRSAGANSSSLCYGECLVATELERVFFSKHVLVGFSGTSAV